MLWFWLNQVFGQISSCQWKHSLPEVVTFVGGKELALKQIMKQMFYAKSESGDTQATANKTLLLSVQSFQFPAVWNMNLPTNGQRAVPPSRGGKVPQLCQTLEISRRAWHVHYFSGTAGARTRPFSRTHMQGRSWTPYYTQEWKTLFPPKWDTHLVLISWMTPEG